LFVSISNLFNKLFISCAKYREKYLDDVDVGGESDGRDGHTHS
jgi:hypothetical protein